MATGTNTTHPPILSTTPLRKSRPVPPLRKPAKTSIIAAAMKAKRPR